MIRDLVARMIDGDEDALAVLMLEFDGYVRKVATRKGCPGHELDDACQETWINTWNTRRGLNPEIHPATWLRPRIVQAVVNLYRCRSRFVREREAIEAAMEARPGLVAAEIPGELAMWCRGLSYSEIHLSQADDPLDRQLVRRGANRMRSRIARQAARIRADLGDDPCCQHVT